MTEEVKALEEDIEAVKDKIEDPIMCEKIRQFVYAPREIQDLFKEDAGLSSAVLLHSLLNWRGHSKGKPQCLGCSHAIWRRTSIVTSTDATSCEGLSRTCNLYEEPRVSGRFRWWWRSAGWWCLAVRGFQSAHTTLLAASRPRTVDCINLWSELLNVFFRREVYALY